MNILVTGATGFIGRHVCARLIGRGHRLTAAVRDPASAARRFPGVRSAAIDMNRMLAVDDWLPLLAGQDAVVNCAGILQSTRRQSSQAIHAASPRALFDACVATGVQRVIEISAVSADAAAGTEYALTKKAADDHLRSLDLDWVILCPSLIYAQGSYGGTSAICGLAGFPLITPLPGDGGQRFQPLGASIAAALALMLPLFLMAPTALATLDTLPVWLAIAYIVLFSSVGAFLLWSQGVARLGPARAGQFIHLMPVFGAALAFAILSEVPTPAQIAGAFLVLCGIVLVERRAMAFAGAPTHRGSD